MRQTILALVRPKLNLSQPENQLTHLIEHILMSPERQRAIGLEDSFFAKDIIFDCGYTSELYGAEYYVVRFESLSKIKKIILENKDNLFIEKIDVKSTADALVEELEEKRAKEISIAEQWERAIYKPTSPAVLQPWFDASKLGKTSSAQIERIFKKLGRPVGLFELSFNSYVIPRGILTKKNLLANYRTIYLTHPQQPADVAAVDILVPVRPNLPRDGAILDFYVKSLSDVHFGILIRELRYSRGLIYHLSAHYNTYANALQISFLCHQDSVKDSISIIKKLLGGYESKIQKYFDVLRERVFIDYELEWDNIRDYALFYLEEALLGGAQISPKERISKLNKKEVLNLNKKVTQLLKNRSLVTILNYSDKLGAQNLSNCLF